METMGASDTKRVLIVEDNDDNRKILVYRLRRLGDIDIEEAANGLDALRIAEHMHLDLVIMDVHMPVMDGLEASRRIRALDTDAADVPIIALTAEPLAERSDADCEAVSDFIQKPIVDPATLRAKVSYWLEHRHGEQRLSAPQLASAAS
jgi:CheY-like chemotaxis protein